MRRKIAYKMINKKNVSLACSNANSLFKVFHMERVAKILWSLSLLAGIALGSFVPIVAMAQDVTSNNPDVLEMGRRIYNEGVLPSGSELTGARPGGDPVRGNSAACVNCHRRSGMGQVEADILIPPITGNFLFATSDEKHLATMDPRVSKLFNQAHEPYTDTTLAAAIRNGINSHGRAMSVVMPHYNLSDVELKSLILYLKQLSSQWSPGVSQSNIRLATVITPDVDPVRRKVFIDMMKSILRQKNSSTVTAMQGRTRHHMTSAAEMVLGTERYWDLEVWELQGAPATWSEQLAARYHSHPVFALVSGLSNSTWQPVHDFCEHEQVPCWFPSVDLPGKNQSQYAFYFSGGVKLESAVLARYLMEQKSPPKHVVQIYREGEVGRAASQALSDALTGSNIITSDYILSTETTIVDSLHDMLSNVKSDDAVMFWLRPEDINVLGKIKPMMGKGYFSAILAKGELAPLSADWRLHSSLIYPYELPENRTKNLDYFHAWLNIGKLPLVDEDMQSEVFFAMNFMTDTLSEMLDNLYRDYLLERAETMLSKREGVKSEQETRDRVALGRAGDLIRKRGVLTMDESSRIKIQSQQAGMGKSQGTTLYPHLSLGAGQRYASKGAYIVRFANGSGSDLIAESELIVP
jgi:cytochrome c553